MINGCTKKDNMLNKILGVIFDRKVQMAFELSGFRKFRTYSDGISFIELRIKTDFYKGDHTPRFTLFLGILNFVLIEMTLYNTHHAEENVKEETPYRMEPSDG